MSFDDILAKEDTFLQGFMKEYPLSDARDRYKRELLPLKPWFEKNGFAVDAELLADSTANVFGIKDEAGYVIRTFPKGHEPRAVIPQLVQPIYKEQFGDLEIEILPKLDRIPKAIKRQELSAYRKELFNAGYDVADHVLNDDVGRSIDIHHFTYRDPAQNRTITVAMAVDPGEVFKLNPNQPIRCSKDYPTLERQWEKQCEIVAASPRLQQLLKGKMPPRLPETEIIPEKGRKRS